MHCTSAFWRQCKTKHLSKHNKVHKTSTDVTRGLCLTWLNYIGHLIVLHYQYGNGLYVCYFDLYHACVNFILLLEMLVRTFRN